MRDRTTPRLRLALCAAALAGGTGPGVAAPLDFLFGGPPLASRPAYRLRRPSAPRATAAEVPLPVPRPHFASDPPPRAETAEARQTRGEPPGATSKSVASTVSEPPTAADAKKPSAGAAGGEQGVAESAPPPNAAAPLPPPKPPEVAMPRSTEPAAPSNSAAPPLAIPAPIQRSASPAPSDTGPGSPVVAGEKPAVAPSGATTAFVPRSPDDDPQCPGRLSARHVDVAPTAIGPQPDDRCTVVEPVRLSALTLADGGKVSFPDHPTIACETADAFTAYVHDLLVPLAKGTFGAPVAEVWTGPGLECRSRDHIFGAKLSAHGQGLAIDVAQLKLADGQMIEVGMPTTEKETSFETAARAGACGYFHTVLGPGSDSYHRTHWHFDLEVRGSHGDGKYCK